MVFLMLLGLGMGDLGCRGDGGGEDVLCCAVLRCAMQMGVEVLRLNVWTGGMGWDGTGWVCVVVMRGGIGRGRGDISTAATALRS